MTDPFEDLGDELISAPVKSRRKAAATRARRKREEKLSERNTLYRLWNRWHSERKAALLAGPYAAAATELVEFLERMTIEDAAELVDLVKRGPWLNADRDTQFEVLGIINAAITYLRESEGLFPIDDPLPFSNEERTAFIIIRDML